MNVSIEEGWFERSDWISIGSSSMILHTDISELMKMCGVEVSKSIECGCEWILVSDGIESDA